MSRDTVAYNEYQRQYQLDRYHRRRQEAIKVLGGCCVICGNTEQLELDHIDRTLKEFPVGKLWSISKKRFDAELSKCQLLCKPHHIKKTREERSVPHGGGLSGKKNCTCVPCKQRKAEYMATYVRKVR